MRASRLLPLFTLTLVAACSGDTFRPSPASPGAAGSGAAGNEAAGTTGDGGTGTGESGAAGGGGAVAGAGGSGGDSAGAAGTGTPGGNGGSAGAAGPPPGGAAGSSGTSGGAGAAGNAGAPSCTAKTPDKPPMTLKCGNGVIEAGETCDDGAIGAMIDGDGCSVNCAVKCDPPSVSIKNHCYSLVDVNALANEIYDGPTMPDQTNDLVRPRWADDPCAGQGVATHLAIFETTAEQNDLQAAAGFEALSAKFAFAGVWIGAGARYRSDQTVDKVAAWRNGEGGLFLGKWKTGNPGVTGGRCVVINKAGTFENVQCFLPNLPDTVRRSVLCEREQACAIVDGVGTPHIGYWGPDKHCYARFPTAGEEPVSRAEAEQTCAKAGAHLPAFETIAELSNLNGANLTSGGVWVGARKLACAGEKHAWETDGAPVNAGAAFWEEKEPAANGGDCATMGRSRRLSAAACDGKAFVLCERDY